MSDLRFVLFMRAGTRAARAKRLRAVDLRGVTGVRNLRAPCCSGCRPATPHVRARACRIEFAADDERRGGDLGQFRTQVEGEGAVQHGAHESLVGIHDHPDEPVELFRGRAPRDEGIDEAFGDGGVRPTRDPLVHRLAELGLEAGRAGAGADQDQPADLVAARRPRAPAPAMPPIELPTTLQRSMCNASSIAPTALPGPVGQRSAASRRPAPRE